MFSGESFFKFYFERSHPLQEKALEYANQILQATDVLVVIGYSFHTSNWETDTKVFENSNRIRKVIFQTSPGDFEHVKYNFLRIKPDLKDIISLYPTLHLFPTPNNIWLLWLVELGLAVVFLISISELFHTSVVSASSKFAVYNYTSLYNYNYISWMIMSFQIYGRSWFISLIEWTLDLTGTWKRKGIDLYNGLFK